METKSLVEFFLNKNEGLNVSCEFSRFKFLKYFKFEESS